MIERIEPGVIKASSDDYNMDTLNREMQRLGSMTLGGSADFYGKIDAGMPSVSVMNEKQREKFVEEARESIMRIYNRIDRTAAETNVSTPEAE